jgi:hypothetical protein
MNRTGDYIKLNHNLTEQDKLFGRYEGEEGIFIEREFSGEVIALFNGTEYYLAENQFIWSKSATIESILKAHKIKADEKLIQDIQQYIRDEFDVNNRGH